MERLHSSKLEVERMLRVRVVDQLVVVYPPAVPSAGRGFVPAPPVDVVFEAVVVDEVGGVGVKVVVLEVPIVAATQLAGGGELVLAVAEGPPGVITALLGDGRADVTREAVPGPNTRWWGRLIDVASIGPRQ